MSSNNTILVMRLRYYKKYIWLVATVQIHGHFENTQWTRWWIYENCPQQYTMNKKLAHHIAHKLNKENYETMHVNSKANIDDFELKDGKLHRCASVVIEPANNYTNLEKEDFDWIIC